MALILKPMLKLWGQLNCFSAQWFRNIRPERLRRRSLWSYLHSDNEWFYFFKTQTNLDEAFFGFLADGSTYTPALMTFKKHGPSVFYFSLLIDEFYIHWMAYLFSVIEAEMHMMAFNQILK